MRADARKSARKLPKQSKQENTAVMTELKCDQVLDIFWKPELMGLADELVNSKDKVAINQDRGESRWKRIRGEGQKSGLGPAESICEADSQAGRLRWQVGT